MQAEMSDSTFIAALERVEGLRSLDQEAKQMLASVMTRRNYAVGAKVFRQGAHGQTMFLLHEGLLRIEYQDRGGNAVILGNVKPGEIVGEMGALDPAPRSVTVIAAIDSVLFGLAREDLDRLAHLCPAADSAIVAMVMRDVARRTQRLDETIRKTLGRPEIAPLPAREMEDSGVLERMWARLTGSKASDR